MNPKMTIIPLIEVNFDQFTPLEQMIANYFIQQTPSSLAAQDIVKELHISSASLTRFAKKCGFAGYREFAFEYAQHLKQQAQDYPLLHDNLTRRILTDYEDLLIKTNSLVSEEQIVSISTRLDQAKRVYFYGKGSSSLVAQELKIRFMRLGMICEAVTDDHMLQWNSTILDSSCLVLALSLSAKTTPVLQALDRARKKGAYTILVTTQAQEHADLSDEVLLVASTRNLSYGNRISPQFPLLIVVDLLFAYYMRQNKEVKEAVFEQTIIKQKGDG